MLRAAHRQDVDQALVGGLVDVDARGWDAALREISSPGLGFPTPDLVEAAAALHCRQADQSPSALLPLEAPLAEGRHFTLAVAAGVVAVRTLDHQRRAATEEAAADRRGRLGAPPAAGTPTRVVTRWSRKSRARMTRRLSELDYRDLFAGGRPAMVTLTYPGEWRSVAPDGKTVKNHVRSLMKRWARKYGISPAYLWKLEFQRRGAPHLHLFVSVPGEPAEFRAWLSSSWASVVDHQDPAERARHELAGTGVDYAEGVRASDPKRLAVYFKKHGGAAGGKEYQHQVPLEWQTPETGPGRFWGYVGVDRVVAEVYVTAEDYVQFRRALRRLAASQQLRRTHRVPRGRAGVDVITGEVTSRRRSLSRPVRRMAAGGLNGGFLLVNDGPALAEALARLHASQPPSGRFLP